MLVWFGGASPFSLSATGTSTYVQVDVPFLVRFQRIPRRVSLDEVGLEVFSATAVGKFLLMPLLGARYTLPAETEQWHQVLPPHHRQVQIP